jgi:Bacterial PH domain
VTGPSPAPGPPPRTWRAIRGRRLALAAALAVLVGAAILGAALPEPFKGGDKISVALMGVPVAAVLLLLARPSVSASQDGLIVRNLVGTRRLSWAEVVSFRLGPDDSWASIDVADGTSLAVMALQTADREQTAAALADLRSRLRAAEPGLDD